MKSMRYRLYTLYGFFLTLPFAHRKVIWPGKSEGFSEYSDVSIYLFEVFLLGYITLSILEHRKYIVSIFREVFHVEHFFLLIILIYPTLVVTLFESNPFSIYLLFKWVIYTIFSIFLYLDLLKIVPRGTLGIKSNNKNCSTWNNLQIIILISLFIQAIIIIIQAYCQKSLGLFFLGESILNPKVNGVATIIVDGNEYLRGYGTFLHPNIAAFFFFTYFLAYYFLTIVPRGTFLFSQTGKNCSTWNISFLSNWQKLFHVEHFFSLKLAKIVPRGTTFLIFTIIVLGFFLTFSKSVILLSFFIFIFFICSTWNNIFKKLKLFHVEQSHLKSLFKIVPRGTIVLIFIFIVGISLYKIEWGSYLNQSILERKIQYLSIPVENIGGLLKGSGVGMYVTELSKKSPGLFEWQLQPIHNTYILALFELGTIPIVTGALYFWLKRKRAFSFSPHNLTFEQRLACIVILGLLFLLSIDHYFWDIEQGQCLFVLLITILIFTFKSQYPKLKNRV